MLTILIRKFVKNREDTANPAVRLAYGKICGLFGILLNLLLFSGKLFGGIISNSIAISADAFNNLSDAGTSIITLVGFRLAGQEADIEHPYGHGRFEYISGLIVSLLILSMGIELGKSSFAKIISPEPLEFSPAVLVILAASVAAKLYMSFYNRRIGNKINSSAMRAISQDSISDTVATSVVFISTIISHFAGINIDGYCGMLVAAFILFTGIKSIRETISPLLGNRPDAELVKEIEELVLSHEGIIGIHDLLVHDYGPGRLMISLHAEVPANGDMLTLHDTIDNIENDLKEGLCSEAVIHMDPVVTDDALTVELRSKVHGIVKAVGDELDMHDFRIVVGPTHTNLIFDVVVPYQFRMKDAEISALIKEKIYELSDDYRVILKIDKN